MTSPPSRRSFAKRSPSTVLASRNFRRKRSPNRLLAEAAAVASFVISQSLSKAGRSVGSLNENERGVVGVLAMLTSDHLSRVAAVSLELTSVAVFGTLFLAHLDEEHTAAALSQAGSTFNELSADPRTGRGILQFGKLTAKFFSTDEDLYLDGMAAPLRSWLEDNA